VLDRFDDGTSVIECHPKTGRTNQIRIHLAHLGFPICGDPVYRSPSDAIEKQTLSIADPPMCLHAWKLGLTHPNTKEMFEIIAGKPIWSTGDPGR